MVGDGEEFVAQRHGGMGHFFNAVDSIRGRGVGVQIAVNVCKGDDLGKLPGERCLNFPAIFPHFGSDPGQAQRLVNILLGLAGDRLGGRRFSRFLGGFFVFGQLVKAPLIEGEALVLRHAAKLDAFILGAGEIEQRRAEIVGRHNAQIDLQAARGDDAGLGVSFAKNFLHFRKRDESIGHFRPIRLTFKRADQIDIPNGFAPAPQAPGYLGLLDLLHGPEPRKQGSRQ